MHQSEFSIYNGYGKKNIILLTLQGTSLRSGDKRHYQIELDLSYLRNKQLVGGHKTGGIAKNVWEKKKKYFEDLLDCVISVESNLNQFREEILRYHNFRGSLYHTGLPVTTTTAKVNKFSELTRDVLESLYNIKYSNAVWEEQKENVISSFNKRKTTQNQLIRIPIEFKSEGGVVRIFAPNGIKNIQLIKLCIHCFLVTYGNKPDRKEILKMLNFMRINISPDHLNARISDLRKRIK